MVLVKREMDFRYVEGCVLRPAPPLDFVGQMHEAKSCDLLVCNECVTLLDLQKANAYGAVVVRPVELQGGGLDEGLPLCRGDAFKEPLCGAGEDFFGVNYFCRLSLFSLNVL